MCAKTYSPLYASYISKEAGQRAAQLSRPCASRLEAALREISSSNFLSLIAFFLAVHAKPAELVSYPIIDRFAHV